MTETEFLDQVEAVWKAIESKADAWVHDHDADIEVTRNGPVLEMEFASGKKMVINAQAPMQQIWLASSHGAFHFHRTPEGWSDTRSGLDFWRVLAEQASLESGEPLA
jgi:CyaY protein